LGYFLFESFVDNNRISDEMKNKGNNWVQAEEFADPITGGQDLMRELHTGWLFVYF
jgi:hypothetical protein